MKENKDYILVVEDDEVSCDLFTEVFKYSNFKNYRIVNYANEAIEICKKSKKVRMVLMDIRLPDKDGRDAMKEIKSMHRNLPVIAQTAVALPCEKDIFLNMGFDDFMVKPIDTKKLFSLINTYYAQPAEI